MKKRWEDIKVGDILKDGSVVTQIHRVHEEDACLLTYDTDKEFTCSYNHVLLVDVKNLPKEGIQELEAFCTFVPLEENFEVFSDTELTDVEKVIVDKFCHNEAVSTNFVKIDSEDEVYDAYFLSGKKRITIKNTITKSEPQKVDEHTYWLTCRGIEYLMNKYHVYLYCNGNIINSIKPLGKLPCFCISTDTGRYET